MDSNLSEKIDLDIIFFRWTSQKLIVEHKKKENLSNTALDQGADVLGLLEKCKI